jgi:hypothetical protein
MATCVWLGPLSIVRGKSRNSWVAVACQVKSPGSGRSRPSASPLRGSDPAESLPGSGGSAKTLRTTQRPPGSRTAPPIDLAQNAFQVGRLGLRQRITAVRTGRGTIRDLVAAFGTLDQRHGASNFSRQECRMSVNCSVTCFSDNEKSHRSRDGSLLQFGRETSRRRLLPFSPRPERPA